MISNSRAILCNSEAKWKIKHFDPPAYLPQILHAMNDFPLIGYPCFAHRILGSPGGKHCESLQRNVWRGAVSPGKSSVFGQRMQHFAVILLAAEVTNVGAKKL